MQHIVILSSLCKWKRTKWLFFVVKRYAVRKAKKWRYAVRKAKIGRYAVRKGGGGVTLMDNEHQALWLIFSRGFRDNSLFFSLCGWRSGVFTLASVLAWRHAWVFVTALKCQTRMRTSWTVLSFYRSDQDVRAVTIWTYWGRNEDVLWSSWTVCKRGGRVMDGSGLNGNELELVTKRTWTGWSRTRTVWKRCTYPFYPALNGLLMVWGRNSRVNNGMWTSCNRILTIVWPNMPVSTRPQLV